MDVRLSIRAFQPPKTEATVFPNLIPLLADGIKFDWSINLGNMIMAVAFIGGGIAAWRDMNWRVKNLETWRKEHQVDSDSRDKIITRMDKILYHVTGGREGNLDAPNGR